MKSGDVLLGVGVFAGAFCLNVVNIANERADYWRPILNSIATRANTAGVHSVWVLPFKGCGFAFGETIHAKTEFGGAPADLMMCRTREGVRFDITTYESRWIRREAR